MTLELKHLRALKAIHEHRTVSAAARELGYSQPAISLQITQLEKSLGTPVLLRTGNGVTLTQAGELLVSAADPVLSRMAQLLVEIEAIAGLRAGRIRVVCFPSAAAVLLPEAFAAMRRDFPGLSFSLIEREPPQALAMLHSGECDIAIVYEYAGEGDDDRATFELMPNERAIKIAEEPVYVALPRSHPLTSRKVVALSDLADSEWIAGCPECRTNLVDLCAKVGFAPNIAFETDDRVAVQSLVGAELGVALVPEMMVAAGGRSLPIELRPCVPISRRIVWVVTTTGLLTVPGVGPTVAALRAAAGTRPPAG